jgi:hypothetical protein
MPSTKKASKGKKAPKRAPAKKASSKGKKRSAYKARCSVKPINGSCGPYGMKKVKTSRGGSCCRRSKAAEGRNRSSFPSGLPAGWVPALPQRPAPANPQNWNGYPL